MAEAIHAALTSRLDYVFEGVHTITHTDMGNIFSPVWSVASRMRCTGKCRMAYSSPTYWRHFRPALDGWESETMRIGVWGPRCVH
jgi:hypothetical protein